MHLGDKSVTTILSGIGIGIGDLPIGSMVTSLLQGGGAKAAAGGRTRGDAYGGDGADSAGEAGTRGSDGAPG